MEEDNPMEKSRRHYSPQQKVAILREHLIEQVPISELCQKHHIHPTLFYQWQKTFFENGAAAFEREPSLWARNKIRSTGWKPSSKIVTKRWLN
jgi:transposase-like protein